MGGGANRETGLRYILDTMETKGIITCKDVRTFLTDLKLPTMSLKKLQGEMSEAGASKEGFTKLSQFFVYVRNQLESEDADADILKSFLMFDDAETGFIDVMVIQDVIGNMGDKMGPEDINDVINMADEDGDGTINYEEIMKMVRVNKGAIDDL